MRQPRRIRPIASLTDLTAGTRIYCEARGIGTVQPRRLYCDHVAAAWDNSAVNVGHAQRVADTRGVWLVVSE